MTCLENGYSKKISNKDETLVNEEQERVYPDKKKNNSKKKNNEECILATVSNLV